MSHLPHSRACIRCILTTGNTPPDQSVLEAGYNTALASCEHHRSITSSVSQMAYSYLWAPQALLQSNELADRGVEEEGY